MLPTPPQIGRGRGLIAQRHILHPSMSAGRLRAWVRSIDATYELVENASVREKYPGLAEKVEEALVACESALHDYGVDGCALSFNGGKDCTVLAHILAAALRRVQHMQGTCALSPIRSLYVACDDPFPDVEEFIRYAASPDTGYDMQLQTSRGSLQHALDAYVNSAEGKGVHAMFVGVRHDDPHGELTSIRAPCDPSWPTIMRIHPILHWDYTDVWAFLRCPVLRRDEVGTVPPYVAGHDAGVPYCAMYDRGYTSLGDRFNTDPNPALYDAHTHTYMPAYRLQDGAKERCGRHARRD